MKQSLYSLIFLLSITTVLSAADSNIVPASTGIYIIGPATISQPGSYIVAQDIMGTITIAADNVFLDLNEKTLFAPAGGNGIEVVDQENIEIRNGIIDGLVNLSVNGVFLESCTTVLVEDVITQGHGIGFFDAGIALPNCSSIAIKNCNIKENRNGIIGQFPATVNDLVITDCIVERNFFQGIALTGNNITIANCQVTGQGNIGIDANVISDGGLITDCIVTNNAAFGISTRNTIITHCSFNRNIGVGIIAENALITYCATSSNQGEGMRIENSTVQNCKIERNSSTGCLMFSNCSAQDSDITANGDSGIAMSGSNCIARANVITNNVTDGVLCNGADNLVCGNDILNNGLSGIRNAGGTNNSFFNNKAQQNGPSQTENYFNVPASTIAVFDLSTGEFISTPTICCDVNLSIVP